MEVHKKQLNQLKNKDSGDSHSPEERKKVFFKTKIRSDSMGAIFGLPMSVLENYKPNQQVKSLKRQKSKHSSFEQTIELGNIGQQYHLNLRKTIMNHTKQIFRPIKKQKSFIQQNNYLSNQSIQFLPNKKKTKKVIALHDHSSEQTLNILQKVILKQPYAQKEVEAVIELRASRLPIIKKNQNHRKQSLINFQVKYPLFQSPIKLQQTIAYTDRSKKVWPAQKPQICGWDAPQTFEY